MVGVMEEVVVVVVVDRSAFAACLGRNHGGGGLG
jgi:hypothetical protein